MSPIIVRRQSKQRPVGGENAAMNRRTLRSSKRPCTAGPTGPRFFAVTALAVSLVLMTTTSTLLPTAEAFSPITTSRIGQRSPAASSASTSSQLEMSWVEVSDFYATYPIPSAMLTCGFKASIADGIAQFNAMRTAANEKQEQSLELRRNLAYVLYGGLFVGIMCHVEYNELFPRLFGTEQPHVLEKVIFDDFISAPLCWLPPAYLIKAMVYDYCWQEGLQKYVQDIRHNGLLLRYWAIWLPAQTVSFSYIPDHMRVAWMALVSFFWFILFSSVASDGEQEAVAVD